MFVIERVPGDDSSANLALYQGDNVYAGIYCGQDSGVPYNLSGYNARLTIGFENPVELTTENGGLIILHPTKGEVLINAPTSMTEGWPAGICTYEFWLIPGMSPLVENLYLQGNFTVKPPISIN